MTRALGGTITTSPQPEIGWQPIEYVSSDITKDWFGSAPTSTVIHWHYETFSVPNGATLLASSAACTNQAWAMGNNLAMQFHIEINRAKAESWSKDADPLWESAQAQYNTVQDGAAIAAGIEPHLAQHQATADCIYRRWLSTTCWNSR